MTIVVFGLPGTGYFRQMQSDRVVAIYVNSDKLRNALKVRGMYTHEDKLKIYHALVEEARRTMVQGKGVVIDSETDFEVYVKIKEQFEEPVVPYLRLSSEDGNINAMLESEPNFKGKSHG